MYFMYLTFEKCLHNKKIGVFCTSNQPQFGFITVKLQNGCDRFYLKPVATNFTQNRFKPGSDIKKKNKTGF